MRIPAFRRAFKSLARELISATTVVVPWPSLGGSAVGDVLPLLCPHKMSVTAYEACRCAYEVARRSWRIAMQAYVGEILGSLEPLLDELIELGRELAEALGPHHVHVSMPLDPRLAFVVSNLGKPLAILFVETPRLGPRGMEVVAELQALESDTSHVLRVTYRRGSVRISRSKRASPELAESCVEALNSLVDPLRSLTSFLRVCSERAPAVCARLRLRALSLGL